MVEDDRVNISKEVNPPAPTHSQPPPTHAPPPPTPVGVPLVYTRAPLTHLLPPTSSGAPLPRVSLTPSASNDHARITVLEGTVNQLATNMTTNMAELFALLRGPNCASSSSTPPSGQGPTLSLFHRWRSSLRIRSYPHRHLFPCRPQLQSIPSLCQWFFRRQAHLLRLTLKPQSFPPTRLYNLTPTSPTKHRHP
ncbi:hypothetical protein CRG98_006173 [Punica granatum]|uniref:Uncharacterized protein n=1 Tax=Punica granatum TaxID=22663 RepID=A0A2I0KYH0_PUNGR|nr:hypothetical protein CRG98_006173 [Punica granatum]